MNDSPENTAIVCQQCAASIDSRGPSAARYTCPNCGSAVQPKDSVSWINVARVGNLAEAGFLTDELLGLGIGARIHQLDDFNALNDRWTAFYLIQVPAENAEEAATRIQSHRDDDVCGKDDVQSPQLPLSSRVTDPLFWRPVALIVLTGIAGIVIGQRLSGLKAGRPMASDSFPSQVNQIGRPFITEPVAGKPRHRLSYDARQQLWLLDTDRDNDGRYELRRPFHATGADR
jgi:hypothetical protein